MAYNLSATVILGAGNTGLTLTASLFDSANASAAGLTTSTLVEVTAGSGTYLWTGTVPDGHRGYLRFDSSGTFKAAVSLNAQEVENPDVKTSTRSSHTAADVWAAATRTLTSFGTLASDVWAVGTRTLTSFGTLAADVWASATRTLTAFAFSVTVATNNDKAGYSLSAAGVQAIWDALTSALTTVGSIGKKLADWVLGSDNKAILSNNAHTGAVIPTVTNLTNDAGITQAGADKVWVSATRTLTSFGTLVADIWANATRTLTSFGTLTTDTAAAVWAAGTRTLTGFGTLVADIWANATRTLTAFAFSVDILQSGADKVWLSAVRTLTSFGTLVADTAAAVWAYATRTLTVAAASITLPLDGTTMTITRGDTISIPVTGLGSLTGRTKLFFTVKDQTSDADTAAIIQIEETAGLVRLNGAAATANQGSLTVTDATNGNITLALVPVASSLLSAPRNYRYDVQKIAGSAVTTLTQGTFMVNPDVTRGIV